jgi:hypothetical protein
MEKVEDILKKMGYSQEETKSAVENEKTISFVGEDIYTKEGWTDVPNYILYHSELSPLGKLVYIGILSYAWGDKDSSFMGQKTLATKLGMGERTVRKGIAELKKYHLLFVQKRGLGLTNRYFLPVRSAKRVSNKYYKEELLRKKGDRHNVPV